jgi:hypothetical protein
MPQHGECAETKKTRGISFFELFRLQARRCLLPMGVPHAPPLISNELQQQAGAESMENPA